MIAEEYLFIDSGFVGKTCRFWADERVKNYCIRSEDPDEEASKHDFFFFHFQARGYLSAIYAFNSQNKVSIIS